MATAITILNRALRIIGVLDTGTAANAADSTDALDTLNALLAEWHEAGIGLPDYSLAGMETELASDVADREALAYQLAERIAPEYGQELPALAMKASAEAMNRLRLRYFQPGTISTAELPGECGAYNINTDT